MSIETLILIGMIIGVSAFAYLVIRYARKRLAEAKAKAAARAELIKKYHASRRMRPKAPPTPMDYAQAMGRVDAKRATMVPSESYSRTSTVGGFFGSGEYYRPQPQGDSFNVLNDLASVAMVASTIRHWNDDSSSSSRVEDTQKASSNDYFGMDDADSRASASNTFSDISSSSSWGGSSSSSDSGPSSDW